MCRHNLERSFRCAIAHNYEHSIEQTFSIDLSTLQQCVGFSYLRQLACSQNALLPQRCSDGSSLAAHTPAAGMAMQAFRQRPGLAAWPVTGLPTSGLCVGRGGRRITGLSAGSWRRQPAERAGWTIKAMAGYWYACANCVTGAAHYLPPRSPRRGFSKV